MLHIEQLVTTRSVHLGLSLSVIEADRDRPLTPAVLGSCRDLLTRTCDFVGHWAPHRELKVRYSTRVCVQEWKHHLTPLDLAFPPCPQPHPPPPKPDQIEPKIPIPTSIFPFLLQPFQSWPSRYTIPKSCQSPPSSLVLYSRTTPDDKTPFLSLPRHVPPRSILPSLAVLGPSALFHGIARRFFALAFDRSLSRLTPK